MITIYAKGASAGRFFLANGVRRPDTYRFERNPKRPDLFELSISVEKFNEISEDLLTAKGNPQFFLTIKPDPAWAGNEAAEEIEKLKAEIEKIKAESIKEIQRIESELSAATLKFAELADKGGDGAGDDAETEVMLAEREAILDLLLEDGADPEKDSPINYLRERLKKPTEPAAPAAAPKKKAEAPKPKPKK